LANAHQGHTTVTSAAVTFWTGRVIAMSVDSRPAISSGTGHGSQVPIRRAARPRPHRPVEADSVLEDLTVAYVIAQPCIDNNDQSCVEVCPVDCITADPSIDRKFYVDPDSCIDCGSCEPACPNAAIFRADRLPPLWVDFAWIDRTWYQDPAAAREAVDVASSAA
jgi:ferredoxin